MCKICADCVLCPPLVARDGERHDGYRASETAKVAAGLNQLAREVEDGRRENVMRVGDSCESLFGLIGLNRPFVDIEQAGCDNVGGGFLLPLHTPFNIEHCGDHAKNYSPQTGRDGS